MRNNALTVTLSDTSDSSSISMEKPKTASFASLNGEGHGCICPSLILMEAAMASSLLVACWQNRQPPWLSPLPILMEAPCRSCLPLLKIEKRLPWLPPSPISMKEAMAASYLLITILKFGKQTRAKMKFLLYFVHVNFRGTIKIST